MEQREINKHLQKALSLIKEDNTLDALFHLDRIIDQTDVPEALSSYGLCIALERGRIKDGIDICIKAIERDRENIYHYLNLGKVYLKDGKKAIAIDIFRKGIKSNSDGGHLKEIEAILDRLGTRKKPVFPFLARKNRINRFCGVVLSKLGLR